MSWLSIKNENMLLWCESSIVKAQSIKIPDEGDNRIPCDMRPGFNSTVFNEPHLVFKGTVTSIIMYMMQVF